MTDEDRESLRKWAERNWKDSPAGGEWQTQARQVIGLFQENEGLRKAEALLRAGLESQSEQMDSLKQEVRGLRGLTSGFAARIAAQSELLTQRSEKP